MNVAWTLQQHLKMYECHGIGYKHIKSCGNCFKERMKEQAQFSLKTFHKKLIVKLFKCGKNVQKLLGPLYSLQSNTENVYKYKNVTTSLRTGHSDWHCCTGDVENRISFQVG